MSNPMYSEGQVVKIKSYENLKANQYDFIYSDERLKIVAGAEVAIYKVINDLRAITWYQVGQWGHNIIEIPEAYIECVAFPCKADSSEEASPTCRPNFFEFANQMRAGVSNGEYTYRDLKELLTECLAILDSKFEKVAKQNKVKEDIEEFLSGIWEKRPTSFAQKRVHYFNPGMLTCDTAAEGSKDESFVMDHICARNFFKVPVVYFGNIPRDKAIIEAIRKCSDTAPEIPIISFEQVITYMKKNIRVSAVRCYNKRLRQEGLKLCLNEINSSFNSVGRSLTHYGKEGEFSLNNNLIELSCFAIQTIVFIENQKQTDDWKLYSDFYAVTQRMINTYKEITDFYRSLNETGLLAAKIRIGDKVSHYCELIDKIENTEETVTNEMLVDTLIDMANYCVMTILWLDPLLNNHPN